MRLLVAYEGSDGARAALHEAVSLARGAGDEVLLLRVLNPLVDAAGEVAPTTEAAMAVVVERTRAALEEAARATGVPATTCAVEQQRHGEDTAEAIERVAEEHDASLIVIGSRRAAGMKGLVLGSVTQHVLRHAHCPVLVVRA